MAVSRSRSSAAATATRSTLHSPSELRRFEVGVAHLLDGAARLGEFDERGQFHFAFTPLYPKP